MHARIYATVNFTAAAAAAAGDADAATTKHFLIEKCVAFLLVM